MKFLAFKEFVNNKYHHINLFQESYQDFAFQTGWEGDEIDLSEKVQPPKSEDMDKKRRRTAAPKIAKMFDHFGPADKESPTASTMKKRVEARFDELSKMTPEQRKAEYKAAYHHAKHIGLNVRDGGETLASNAKTDTASDIPTKHGKKGQIPLAMSMTPDDARHYTSPDASTYKSRNSCSGSFAGCRKACLAKHGNYEFATNKGHMDVNTQSLSHNEAATRNHATRTYHTLEKYAHKAKKEGKSVLTRFSTTNEEGSDIYGDATEKHFGVDHLKANPHKAKHQAPVIQMRYSKKLDAPHRPDQGIHSVYSDPGPMVRRTKNEKGETTHSVEHENLQRRRLLRRAVTGDKKNPGKGTYTVFNRKRPSATSKPDDPVTKEYNDTMNHLHTVRRYEEHHSTPEKGEQPEYHHPNGHGRVVHNGKSFRYQDHPVADKIKDVHGEELHPGDHDSRNADTSTRTFKDRHGNKVGHVVAAFATASTSNHDLHHSGLFHHVENIDKHGVYHDGHPAEMALAGHQAKEAPSTEPKVKPKFVIRAKAQ